jgi:hypothetical protein
VTQVGGEVALVLNDQAQELLGVAEGDTVFVKVAEDGSVSLAKQDMSLEARRERPGVPRPIPEDLRSAREIGLDVAEPYWLDEALLLAPYEDVVVASGGAAGLRDRGLL